jgi:hypothetical protein
MTFDELYETLHDRVVAFCARLTGCRVAAADLSQHVVDRHLEACVGCRGEIDGLRAVDGMIAVLSQVRPSVALGRRPVGWLLAASLALALALTLLFPRTTATASRVETATRTYQVAVEGGELLSVEIHDNGGR